MSNKDIHWLVLAARQCGKTAMMSRHLEKVTRGEEELGKPSVDIQPVRLEELTEVETNE